MTRHQPTVQPTPEFDPLPPAGYQSPYTFHYPTLMLQLGGLIILFLVASLVSFIIWSWQGRPAGWLDGWMEKIDPLFLG